jgi:hypothetical protein
VSRHINLVCGLSIRGNNQTTLEEQRRLFAPLASSLSVAILGDKGSYVVTTELDSAKAVELIAGAIRSRFPNVKGAAVVDPESVGKAIEELSRTFQGLYGSAYRPGEFGLKAKEQEWRAGLAYALHPDTVPAGKLPRHETKNALIVGSADGAVLVAKRVADNIHWGSIVTDPAKRVLKRTFGIVVEMTSRSGNTLRTLVDMATKP